MQKVGYERNCPECGRGIFYSLSHNLIDAIHKNTKCRYCCNVIRGKSSNRKGCHHTEESKRAISEAQIGRKLSNDTRLKMSSFQKRRYSNPVELQKMAGAVKLAMHRPDVRKRHIEALHQSNWIKVRTDKGLVEMINCWNKMGFHFDINYQVKTDSDLFYVDGYDKEKNVVLEYDAKYHNSISQKQKDLVRQKKIIDILRPKKFWRYDVMTKQCRNVLEKS
jgi:hypothetical protein